MSIYTASRSGCPPCPAPCKPCLPCEGGRIVEDKPKVDLPKSESRIEYVPIERSVVEYEVRERTQRIPRQRKITQYREQKRVETIPVEKTVEDYYAVEVVKQYFPQLKPKVEVQKVPVEIVSYQAEIIPREQVRKITKQEKPELFRGQYEDRVEAGRKGEYRRIDPSSIKEGSKVYLENGQVVEGRQFIQMIRSNPSYIATKTVGGDLSKSGSGGATYAQGGSYAQGGTYATGGSGSGSGSYAQGGSYAGGVYSGGANLNYGGAGGYGGSTGGYSGAGGMTGGMSGGMSGGQGGYIVSGGAQSGSGYNMSQGLFPGAQELLYRAAHE